VLAEGNITTTIIIIIIIIIITIIKIFQRLGHCAAFQFGFNTRELCFKDPHRLKNIFTFCNCNAAGNAFSWTVIIISSSSQ